jgi:TonB family protein
MAYEYLIRRLLPFSLGFLSAVFVTSLFQTVGSITETVHVPEVLPAYHGSSYSCKNKFRDHLAAAESDLVILHKPRPIYPTEARENGTEGTVRLRVSFLANGEIGSIESLNDIGNGLTEQAVAAAREIRFQPATKNGIAVSTTKEVQYTFSIY